MRLTILDAAVAMMGVSVVAVSLISGNSVRVTERTSCGIVLLLFREQFRTLKLCRIDHSSLRVVVAPLDAVASDRTN